MSPIKIRHVLSIPKYHNEQLLATHNHNQKK